MSDPGRDDTPRAVPADPDASKRPRGLGAGLLTGVDAIEVLIYGGSAVAVLGYVGWLLLAPVWRGGSLTTRSLMLGLGACAVTVVANDIRSRRWSLLSRFLTGALGLTVVLILIVELLVAFQG
jgi:hypothetical protein